MSELEKAAKKVGKKVKKPTDLGHGAEFRANDDWQKKYGIDYLTGTGARRHAQDVEAKAKALADIRDIYEASGNDAANLQSTITVTEKDVEAYKAFQDLEYLRDFDDFTGKAFLKGATPAQVKWIHDIYPDIFDRRVKELEKVLNVQKKVAMLNILGPQSKEDLLFMYELENMKLRDRAKYEQILETSVATQVGAQKQWTRGMLNVAVMFNSFPSRNERRVINNAAHAGTYMGAKPQNIIQY
jgi:hypothetical protein